MQAEGLVGHRAVIGSGSKWRARLVAIVTTAVFLLTASPARAIPDTDIPLMIQTLPATSGLRFSLDGRTFTSDGNGLALITVSQPGTYTLKVLESSADSGVRTEFHRWSDGSRSSSRSITIETFTRLDAGFETFHLTRFDLSAPDESGVSPDSIQSLVLTGSDGSRLELSGTTPRWLKSATTVAQGQELEVRRISYRVREAVVDGERVVQPRQEPFAPTRAGQWTIEISPNAVGEDASLGAGRAVEVVQPTTTNEPSIDRLVVGLVLAVALLALLCLMLLRRRPATRQAMATAGAPVAIVRDMVPGRRVPREETRTQVKRASAPEDKANLTTGAPPPSPKETPAPAETPAPQKKVPAPPRAQEVRRSAPEKASIKEEPLRSTAANRSSDNAVKEPPSAPVEPPQDDAEIDSYEKLGRSVSSILGSAYESADDVQRAAKNDARELLDRAVAEGAAVRDRAHERSDKARETAQQKADGIIDEAESYADQVREKTRRRVAELEEHLRRHQRLRAREQELRKILSQIEGMIPKLRSEMDGSEVRERSKTPFPSP